jgi:myosin heavy subunit
MMGSMIRVLSVMAMLASGCVWKSSYEDLSEKYDHVKAVKNEQEIERDGLRAEVRAVHNGYGQQAGKLSLVEATVRQQVQEVAAVKTRVATVTQEMVQQRSELMGIQQKLTEALQAMQSLMEKQGDANKTLDSLVNKVDALKKPVAVKHSAPSKTERAAEKGAVERALEQRAKQQAAAALSTIPGFDGSRSDPGEAKGEVHPVKSPSEATSRNDVAASVRPETKAVAGEEVGKRPLVKSTFSEKDLERFRTMNEQELGKLTAEAVASTKKDRIVPPSDKPTLGRGGAEKAMRQLLPARTPSAETGIGNEGPLR